MGLKGANEPRTRASGLRRLGMVVGAGAGGVSLWSPLSLLPEWLAVALIVLAVADLAIEVLARAWERISRLVVELTARRVDIALLRVQLDEISRASAPGNQLRLGRDLRKRVRRLLGAPTRGRS